MGTLSLDSHAELAARVVALRAERNSIAAELKEAEGTLNGLLEAANADTGVLGGEVLFQITQGPDKDKVDTDALIASLSPKTVARFVVRVAGRRSLRLSRDADEVISRFFTRSAA